MGDTLIRQLAMQFATQAFLLVIALSAGVTLGLVITS